MVLFRWKITISTGNSIVEVHVTIVMETDNVIKNVYGSELLHEVKYTCTLTYTFGYLQCYDEKQPFF